MENTAASDLDLLLLPGCWF